jgi:predicted transcriptional regulator
MATALDAACMLIGIVRNYNERGRIVRLPHGQAYFDVARDHDRPFQVEPGDVRVATLGTAGDIQPGIRAMTLISKSNPASQLTPIAVQFG